MKEVIVLFGGNSIESDISIITAIEAIGNIDRKKFKVTPIYINDCWYMGDFFEVSQFCPFKPYLWQQVCLWQGVLYLNKGNKLKKLFKPDAALLCTHGGMGENGSLQGLLEINGIPYTASKVMQSAIGMDKSISKQIFENMILNVPKYVTLSKTEYLREDVSYVETFLDYPMIVKPVSQGSSIGISKVASRHELKSALDLAFCYDDKTVIEKSIEDFVEVNCACFRNGDKIIVSETEIPLSSGEILTFKDKYIGGDKIMPSSSKELPNEIVKLIKGHSKRIYCHLELDGVVRFDYLVTSDLKKVYINEMNTIPGALAHYLFKPLGIDYKTLLTYLIDDAISVMKNKIKPNFSSEVLSLYGGKKNFIAKK